MNLKRTFGTILTVLGIIGLIYCALQIMQSTGMSTKNIVVIAVVAVIFFFTGVSLIRTTKDES